jgi:hypothetical protein
MRIEPEISGASIVMLGSFNPEIFQPFWFAENKVISREQAAGAQIGLIHPDISSFRLEGEFNIQVERDRFSIDRGLAPLIRIADVVCRVFGDLLPHTPIHQVGMNRLVHFNVRSEAVRDEIGRKLAPWEPWGQWGRTAFTGEGKSKGGLLSLTMTQRNLSDRPSGWFQVKVEPSNVIGGGRTGIYMELNDHYDLARRAEGTTEIVEIVRTRFDSSIERAESVVDQVVGLQA